MTPTQRRLQALADARDLADDLGRFDVGMCLRQIRTLLAVEAHDFTPGDGKSPDAAQAWAYAKHRHPITDPDQLAEVPAGAPVFWTGGSAGHGHIALKAGHKPGRTTTDVWTTDYVEAGRLDRVDGRRIAPGWGLQLAGWSEDLNGVLVYTPPAAAPAPRPATHVETIVRLLDQALVEGAGVDAKRVRVHQQLDQLRTVRRALTLLDG